MRNKILLIICTLLLASCVGKRPAAEVKFNEAGVSFVCPSGWEITDRELDGETGFIALEKTGYSSSGIITVSWIAGELSAEDYMDINVDLLKDGGSGFSDISIVEIPGAAFAGYEAEAIEYGASFSGIPFYGDIFTFVHSGKTFSIMRQGAREDMDKYIASFDRFEKSFKVS